MVFGQDTIELTKARDDALRAYDVQRNLPGYDVEEQNQVEGVDASESEEKSADKGSSLTDFFESLATLLQVIFIVTFVVLMLLLLRGIYSNKGAILKLSRKREKQKKKATPVEIINIEKAKSRLEDAKALAAQGHYEEAVHLLLLHIIDDLKRHNKRHIPISWTAREVLGKSGLPPKAAAAMQSIVGLVELSFFGGHLIGRPGYESCIKDYENVLSALEGEAV